MKRFPLFSGLFLAVIFAVLCFSCDESMMEEPTNDVVMQVTFPTPGVFSQSFNILPGNKIEFTIKFNDTVDIATVVVGTTLILSTSTTASVNGTITWNAAKTELTFVSTNDYTSFCSFTPDCFMNLLLIGTDAGAGAILDAQGFELDGDDDGMEGGDWTTTYGILG